MKLRHWIPVGILCLLVVMLLVIGSTPTVEAGRVTPTNTLVPPEEPTTTPTNTPVPPEEPTPTETVDPSTLTEQTFLPLMINQKQVNILHPVEGGVYNPAIGLQVQIMPFCAWYVVALEGDNYTGTKWVPWDAWLVLPQTPVSIASDYEYVPAGRYTASVYCEDLEGTVLYGPTSVNFTIEEDLSPLPTPGATPTIDSIPES